MSKKKPEIVVKYANAEYFEKALGIPVEPVSRKTKISVSVRDGVPHPWNLATKDVWRSKEDGTVYATLYARKDADAISVTLAQLGCYLHDKSLELVEIVSLPAGCPDVKAAEYAAIVRGA